MKSTIRTALAVTAGAAVTGATVWLAGTALAQPTLPPPVPAPGNGNAALPAPGQRDIIASTGPAHARYVSVEGTVSAYRTAPRGEINGAYLADGTVVAVPPHEGSRFAAVAVPGGVVRVDGWSHVTRHGETHLRADTVTDTGTGASMTVHHPAPPR
jgi:hypothetical protein